jgi:DNA polymerase III subunit delta'
VTLAADERPVAALFADVVGQESAVAALRNAARQPVHAYLFLGASGSGVRPAARGFAAALLCPHGGCGECGTCRRALAGSHPDLVVVERTGAALAVDDARRIALLAQRKPFEAARQVLVVTDVHLAVRSAPALLKTLEEPPPATVFVVLCDVVPPELATIASRCVEVGFPPIPPIVITEWLVSRGVDPERARIVADGAGGEVDRARLLAEDDDYVARHELWRSVPARLNGDGALAASLTRDLMAAAESAVSPLREEHGEELAVLEAESESLGERSVPGRRDIVDRHHREERRWRTDEIRSGLGVLARAYRDRLVNAVSSGRADDQEVERCRRATDAINAAALSLERNPNESLMLESLLLRLGTEG